MLEAAYSNSSRINGQAKAIRNLQGSRNRMLFTMQQAATKA
jgi:hypothetical protein